jgi:uncharacterized protein HemX
MPADIQKILTALSIITVLAGGGVGYGIMQERINNLQKETISLRSEVDDLKANAVRKEELKEVVKEFKEANKAIQEDVKTILDRLPRGVRK